MTLDTESPVNPESQPEGEGNASSDGSILGTSLHGLWESDGFRAAFLARVAARAGVPWAPSGVSFAAARAARFDLWADLLQAHLDIGAVERLIGAAPLVPGGPHR